MFLKQMKVLTFDLLDAEASKVSPGSEGVVLDHWQATEHLIKIPILGSNLWVNIGHVLLLGRAIYGNLFLN